MIDLLEEYDLEFHIKSEKNLSYAEGVNIERSEGLIAGRSEGLITGRSEGAHNKLAGIVRKKLSKGLSAEAIADALKEDINTITAIINELDK